MSKRLKVLALSLAAALASACSSETSGEAVGGVEQAVSAPSETALYVGVCGFGLASYDPLYAIRFYVESTFTPSAANGARTAGALTLAMTPLLGWNVETGAPQMPASVSLSETRGDRVTAKSAVSDGAFEASYPVLDLPAEADSIVGAVARVERLKLTGSFDGGDRFCAGFSGMLTTPLEYEFVREENTCLFLKVRKGDALPKLTAADFHCP